MELTLMKRVVMKLGRTTFLFVFLIASLVLCVSTLKAGSEDCGIPFVCYHGGPVLGMTKVTAIFWGPEWTNASLVEDKITGMDSFFTGFGNSHYASLVTEYVGAAGAVSTYQGHVIDKSSPPASAPSGSTLIGKACSVAKNNPPDNGIFLIYTSNYPAGFTACGLTYTGSCRQGNRQKAIEVGFIPNLDGLSNCDARDVYTSNSQGLAAIANITAAAMTNIISDPTHLGWYDSAGLRAATKCRGVYPPVAQIFSNGSQFYIWGVFSNAAYMAGTGLPNESGYPGCVY
jgi:hypothetical protein